MPMLATADRQPMLTGRGNAGTLGYMRTGLDSGSDETPIEQLARVADWRREIAREEEVAVRRARLAGLSWAEIGTLLGTTKQAMHKKYRRVG